jgi:3-deoxy-manno-octulosonate cytidylyltransferase (CMP-KDO synthetase)
LAVDCLLPARLGSSRFPGKPLALISGVPLVVRAARQALAAGCFARVAVVTEDDEIVTACRNWKIESLKTPSFPTGTDRVAWAAQSLGSEWVVNLQGDEPLFPPQALQEAAEHVVQDPQALWTCAQAAPLSDAELADPDVVKICLDCPEAGESSAFDFRRELPLELRPRARVHVGLYAGSVRALARFAALEQPPVELNRRIEPLRALDAGMAVRALVRNLPRMAVDRPEHVAQVEAVLQQKSCR